MDIGVHYTQEEHEGIETIHGVIYKITSIVCREPTRLETFHGVIYEITSIVCREPIGAKSQPLRKRELFEAFLKCFYPQ